MNTQSLSSAPARRSESDLNRIDPAVLQDNVDLIREHAVMLNYVAEKAERFPGSFRDDPNSSRHYDYTANASLAVLSHYPKREDLAQCRLRRFGRDDVRCGALEFCPYCNWIAGQKLRDQYCPSFDLTNWHFVTLSLHNARFGLSSDKIVTIQACWHAYAKGLTSLVRKRLCEGVLWVEELSVSGFLPLRVLPHAHALVAGDTFGQQHVDHLAAQIRAARFKGRRVSCNPDLHFREVATEADLSFTLGYMSKPIDAATPYAVAWRGQAQEDWQKARRLNEEASTFCESLLAVRDGRSRIQRLGRLHHASRRTLMSDGD